MPQAPSVGRIVHYYGESEHYAGQPIAALIVEVDDESTEHARLNIFWPLHEEPIKEENRGSIYTFSEDPKPGHWSWPPRV
ncbi:hypothetical protein [Arthrobacter sp. Z1-15]